MQSPGWPQAAQGILGPAFRGSQISACHSVFFGDGCVGHIQDRETVQKLIALSARLENAGVTKIVRRKNSAELFDIEHSLQTR